MFFWFTYSSTGPVTGAPGPAESSPGGKQKFGGPLPTSLESPAGPRRRGPDGRVCVSPPVTKRGGGDDNDNNKIYPAE